MANPVMEKFKDSLNAELVYSGRPARKGAPRRQVVRRRLCASSCRRGCWIACSGCRRFSGDDVATVIFTSGSTGMPKGVMLTHHNIATNVEAIEQVVHPRPSRFGAGDRAVFSFAWASRSRCGGRCCSTFARRTISRRWIRDIVAKLARMRTATILLATPTFLRTYLRRCEPEELSSLEVVVAGAEKLPISLCDAFEKKFGIRPVEGYGTTELSPLVSVNVPPSRSKSATIDCKEGSVGRPVPSVSAKIVDPETCEDLPLGTPGMLLIKGPNVMKGYLGQPEETAKVMHDGWYITGDIAMIDTDGFIHITGRLSRFSKIGGEMVPHIRIEEAIQKILGVDESQLSVVVTSVPDERKGERIVVVHTPLTMSPKEICERLGKIGVPNLWIPTPIVSWRSKRFPCWAAARPISKPSRIWRRRSLGSRGGQAERSEIVIGAQLDFFKFGPFVRLPHRPRVKITMFSVPGWFGTGRILSLDAARQGEGGVRKGKAEKHSVSNSAKLPLLALRLVGR